MSNDGEWFESLEEAPPTMRHMVQLSMFSPTLEESENFHLERWYQSCSIFSNIMFYL